MTSWYHGENKQMMTVTAHWWARKELMQTLWFGCRCCQHIQISTTSQEVILKWMKPVPPPHPTLFLCLSFTYSFPFCYFHSIYVIRGLWICTTLVKILSNLTWIRTVTVKINVPLLYLHILAREQQFIRSDPTFQGWCVLMVKNNPESTVAAQQKLYHSVRMPKFQLMQIPS